MCAKASFVIITAMSSRYHSKRGNNVLNKENEGAPLNMIKRVQPHKKEVCDKKPAIKQSKSLVLADAKPDNALAPDARPAEDAKKEERKRDALRFRRSETERTMAVYSKCWIADMKDKEAKSWPRQFLESHKISASVRAKMVVSVD
jgi:type IV secretory pathway VirB10-like protein